MKKQMRLELKYRARRQALKALIIDTSRPIEERLEASRALAKLPRNASPVEHRNRCKVTGRPRGYLRKFGMSRISCANWPTKARFPASRSPVGKPDFRKQGMMMLCR